MAWMGSKANIAAIVALNVTDLQDGIVFWAIAEKKWLSLDKSNTTATTNDKSCWAATGGGRWFLSCDSTVVSSTQPAGAAATGTKWIWQENSAVNSYDSVITYVYNGTAWVEIDTRMRVHAGTPASLSKTPNSDRESWKDTTDGTVYTAFSGGWIVSGGAS